MKNRLNEIINFRGERLFNGAVNIEWFSNDPLKSQIASEVFVFHGPTYHSVIQEDIGDSHGHKLTDTANFTRTIINRCFGFEEKPFTLAIAGYGTGKSHLGLTIANLVNSPHSETADRILNAIALADEEISKDIRRKVQNGTQPSLVIALNGMKGFDLSAEITKQITTILKRDGHDTKPLDDLRPRFGQAISLVEMSNETVRMELMEFCKTDSVKSIIEKLSQQNEILYSKVYEFFEKKGMPIHVLAGESVRDVIEITTREYCGAGKPYKSVLILFDEFGKYTEFATIRSQIAGIGVLQDLFEAVQANSNLVCFVGFIQFELSAYINRIAPEYKNEILRYITRYQSADKLYLSVNLETLIANLIEKKEPEILDNKFNSSASFNESKKIIKKMSRRFPILLNYRAWCDEETFHSVIRKGCWPLSPYTTWLLFYLTSAGKHLQERSALTLLGNSFQDFYTKEIDISTNWTINPVDICSDEFINELISSEESGQQGSITHSYVSVMDKHSNRLSQIQINILRAILLGSKLGLINEDKNDALDFLSELSAVSLDTILTEISQLQEEYNVIEWDETFKGFDILGDAVPRTQFLSYLRQRAISTYDEHAKSTIFASKAADWCDLLIDLECDFAEENKITTQEWRYSAVTTNLDYLAQHIKMASDKWLSAMDVDQSRGTIIYCYAEQSRSEGEIRNIANSVLKDALKATGMESLPILIVLVHDEEGILGQFLAEYSIIDDFTGEEKSRFGNLVDAHKEKLDKSIRETIDVLIKKRIFITTSVYPEELRRLTQIGKFIFSNIYKKPISFPFDGFSTARGNAADSCYELTSELLHGRLDFNLITAKTVKVKNRAITVLKENWGIFNRNGSVTRRPTHSVIRHLTEHWDELLLKDNKISILSMVQELCLPPYGANIASAGLLLGVYVAPRYEDLLIMKKDTQLSIEQWLQEGIFRGKFISPVSLRDTDLIKIGEASSEWEVLLDEWEQCDSYLSRINYLENSTQLKQKVPIPFNQIYREVRLVDLSKSAITEIGKSNKIQEDAWNKIDNGYKNEDCNLISWGASLLKNLIDKMNSEVPLWTDAQISSLSNEYAKARQYTIQFFDVWLPRQTPKSPTPSDVGDFKIHMLKRIGVNLKNIDLEDQYTKLEEYTNNSVKRTELIVEARQLIANIKGWISEHQDAIKTKKIAEARILKSKGIEFSNRLNDLINRGVIIPDIDKHQDNLSNFINQLEAIEKQLIAKASALWDSTIKSDEDIDSISLEIDSLISSFEGLDTDLEDLFIMKKALKVFRDCNEYITNTSITWEEFNKLEDRLLSKCSDDLTDEEVPWDYDEVIKELISRQALIRTKKSKEWMDLIIRKESEISKMNAGEANQLVNQISVPPLFITKEDREHLGRINKKVVTRLNDLSIEYLIEKFNELSLDKKEEFVKIVNGLMKKEG